MVLAPQGIQSRDFDSGVPTGLFNRVLQVLL